MIEGAGCGMNRNSRLGQMACVAELQATVSKRRWSLHNDGSNPQDRTNRVPPVCMRLALAQHSHRCKVRPRLVWEVSSALDGLQRPSKPENACQSGFPETLSRAMSPSWERPPTICSGEKSLLLNSFLKTVFGLHLRFITYFFLLQFVAIEAIAQSFEEDARQFESDSRLCIGCFPEVDGMRVYFVWKSSNDLDMHVFGPAPIGRREIFYGNRDSVYDSFGRQRCDDLGGPGRCEIRGERFIVARQLGLSDSSQPYCFGFRLYGGRRSNDSTFSVLVGLGGENVLRCEGSIDTAGGSENPTVTAGLSSTCESEFNASGLDWAAKIELDPLHAPEQVNKAPFKTAGAISCRAK